MRTSSRLDESAGTFLNKECTHWGRIGTTRALLIKRTFARCRRRTTSCYVSARGTQSGSSLSGGMGALSRCPIFTRVLTFQG